MQKSGDLLIQNLYNKALILRGIEALYFWPVYDLNQDAQLNWDCPN